MSGATLTVDLRGLDAIAANLERLARAGEDMTPLMDDIGSYGVAVAVDHFINEVAPDGTPWTPSARALATGGQTLTNSARLRNSITHEPGNDQVEIGTNVIYAAIHHFGGKTGRNHATNMPPREFLGFGPYELTEIGHMVDDYLNEVMQ